MAKFDKDELKQAAAGRWPEVFASVAQVDANLFDGKHHACPKCGGKDRFRLIDRAEGACLCNQCFSAKNGDGISVVQWLTGWSFGETLSAIARYCNVKPLKSSKSADPAEPLQWMPWNETLAGLWCLKKKPIKTEAIKRIGGRFARYHNQYTVIAIPVWGPQLDAEPAVGWIIYRPDGNELPKGPKDSPQWVKVKLVEGSGQGVVCNPHTFAADGELWKAEGSTDLLTLLSINPELSAFTTANGAGEKPLDWIVKLCEGRDVIVIHDADKPGQDGATFVHGRDGSKRPGWCPRLAELAASTRNLTLPFPVEPTKGQDVRDYFAGGGTMEMLRERLEKAETFGSDQPAESPVDQSDDDPHRLAKININQYESEHGGKLIFWRDEWWRYRDGVYKRIARNDLRSKINAMIRAEFISQWHDRKRTGRDADKPVQKVTPAIVTGTVEAMQSICRISWNIDMQSWLPTREQRYLIGMKNGILDLDAVFRGKDPSEFMGEHTPDWFSTIKLDYAFDENADCPLWDEYLWKTFEGDSERVQLVQEWAGYLLTPGNSEQKFLALEGEGGNGKTVFMAAMTAMIGRQNISSVPLEKFGGRFDLYNTIGKMVNICGDVGEIDRVAEGQLKDFTGGGSLLFDRKGIEPVEAIPSAKLMMSWNTRPRFRDRSHGLWRRLLLVPFNRRVPDEEKIPGMTDPDWWIRQGEVAGILLWAIAGLHRLKRSGRFTMPKVSRDATKDYELDSNPALEFITTEVEPDAQSYVRIEWLYRLYVHWAERSGHRPLGIRQFGKEIRKHAPYAERRRLTFEGRPWVYNGMKFSNQEIFSIETDREKKEF